MARPSAEMPHGSWDSCPTRSSLACGCRTAPAPRRRRRSISPAWRPSAKRSIQLANRRLRSPVVRSSGVSARSIKQALRAPYLPCRLHNALELALLLIRAEQVADHIRREAALRADRELIKRQDLRGFINAALECVDSLQLWHLGADEAQHDHLALRHEAQRREAAGAWTVIFEQEAVMRQRIEQALGDRVISSFTVPHAALVAAAEMDASGDAFGQIGHHG